MSEFGSNSRSESCNLSQNSNYEMATTPLDPGGLFFSEYDKAPESHPRQPVGLELAMQMMTPRMETRLMMVMRQSFSWYATSLRLRRPAIQNELRKWMRMPGRRK